MKLVFSHRLKKKELWKNPDAHDMEVILRSCKKNIYEPINWDIPPSTQLIKVYATSKSGAKRIVFLLETETSDRFFLFYRDKDDEIGENVTIKNPAFRKALDTYLDILEEDMSHDAFDIEDVE